MSNSPRGFKFSSSNRLKTARDFGGLRHNRSKYFSQDLIFFYKNNGTKKRSRLGVSVSKKSGNAVTRNSLKRSIREWFRCSAVKNKGLDLLVVFNKKTSPHCKKDIKILDQMKSFEMQLIKETTTHG